VKNSKDRMRPTHIYATVDEWMRLIAVDRMPSHRLRYDAYRPNDNAYDKAYHATHFSKAVNEATRSAHPHVFRSRIFRDYYAVDVNAPEAQAPDILMMWDSHYYWPDQDFPTAWRNTHLHVVGMSFSLIPGKYRMPFGEGAYNVDSGHISMQTNATGYAYRHPNVSLKTLVTVLHTGWLDFILYYGPISENRIYHNWTPSAHSHPMMLYTTPQDVWIKGHQTEVKKANPNVVSNFAVMDTPGVKEYQDALVKWAQDISDRLQKHLLRETRHSPLWRNAVLGEDR